MPRQILSGESHEIAMRILIGDAQLPLEMAIGFCDYSHFIGEVMIKYIIMITWQVFFSIRGFFAFV